tara:strand:+ start:513 stop:725 length:213 start_codon:yes stop_codon:yes gene_type:complete
MEYTTKQILTREWDNWVGKKEWNFFRTVINKHNLNAKRNHIIMTSMEQILMKKVPMHEIFLVMERSESRN